MKLVRIFSVLCVLGIYFPSITHAWVKTYGDGLNDYGRAVAVDSGGNTYVAGRTSGFTTIKYAADGSHAWVKTLNNGDAQALAVDHIGNIYVTGSIDNGAVTVKYDSNGVEQWVRPYGSEGAQGNAIAVDSSGSIYVAVGSVLIKYDSTGNEIWQATTSCTGILRIAMDSTGNIITLGPGILRPDWDWFTHYVTIKYSPDGNLLWEKWLGDWDTQGKPNELGDNKRTPVDLALDQQGNIYVTGFSRHRYSYRDWMNNFHTIKYDPSGNLLWRTTYDGGLADYPSAIAVDSQGNAYVTGYRMPSSSPYWWKPPFVTVKYDTNGNEQWVKEYDGAGGVDIAIDKYDNVSVSGNVYDKNDSRAVVIKYDGAGNEVQVKRAPQNTSVSAITLDTLGNIYAVGVKSKINNTGTDTDILAIKYDASGTE